MYWQYDIGIGIGNDGNVLKEGIGNDGDTERAGIAHQSNIASTKLIDLYFWLWWNWWYKVMVTGGKGLVTGVKLQVDSYLIMVNLVIDGNGDKGGGSADTAHRLSSDAD